MGQARCTRPRQPPRLHRADQLHQASAGRLRELRTVFALRQGHRASVCRAPVSPPPVLSQRRPRTVPIHAVWFDVGEVLVNETREYHAWADWLGIPRHTFSAMFGAVIARGEDHSDVFDYFRPGFDLAAQRQARLDAGLGEYLNSADLYPDARPCLQALTDAGYYVGIAGNQPTRAGHFLRELNLPCDHLATSDDWGAAKPDVAFFQKLTRTSGH